MTLPNFITIARFIMVPLIILAMINDEMPTAFTLFLLAGVYDGLDGFIARHFDQKSELGAWLDPIADKVLVALCLLALCSAFNWPLMLMLPTLVIIGRDVAVTVLRFATPADVPVTRLAKVKTALELVGIGGILLAVALAGGLESPQIPGLLTLAWLAVWTAAILSAWTGWLYVKSVLATQDHQ